jgi:hypothetical protein
MDEKKRYNNCGVSLKERNLGYDEMRRTCEEKMFEVNHRTNDVKCEQNTFRSERSRSARYHLPILTGVTCFMGIFSGQGML